MARRTKMRVYSLAVIALILGPLPGCGESPPAAPATKHVLVYQGAGWRGIVVVNQLPVDIAMDAQGQQRGVPITEWVQGGMNEVAMVAECDPGTITPLGFQVGTHMSPDATDIKLIGTPVPIAVPAEGEAGVGSTTFQAPPIDDWIWQRAQVIQTPNDQDIQEIRAVLERFYGAFNKRSVDELLSVLETRAAIKARALGMTPEAARKNDRERLERLFASNTPVQLLDPKLLTIRQFGRGIMIYPTKLDGTMPLVYVENKLNPQESYICTFMSLCKIDGRWVQIN